MNILKYLKCQSKHLEYTNCKNSKSGKTKEIEQYSRNIIFLISESCFNCDVIFIFGMTVGVEPIQSMM